MNLQQALNTSIRNLCVNKKRTIQSMLGFVVGMAAMFAIFCLAFGLLNQVRNSYNQYSPNLLWMGVYMREEAQQTFTEDELAQLLAEHTDLFTGFSALVYLQDNLSYGDKLYEETGALGVGVDFLQTVTALKLAEGRFLQPMDIDRQQNVCVVGSYIANEIMGGDALGQTVKIRGENYTVVGVLQEAPVIDEDWNIGAYIPWSNANKLTDNYFSYSSGNYYRSDYYINASSLENVKPLRQVLWDGMEAEYGKYGDKHITNLIDLNSKQKNGYAGILMMLSTPLFFALIVLLVGIVGIMNMMLAIVDERTREIGIRKAFGARNQDIKRQFMLESIFISLTGGLLGILLGIPAVWLTCQVVQLPPELMMDGLPLTRMIGVPLAPVLISLLLAVLMGIVSGTYPAAQAAKMEPVAALRK